MFSTFFKKLYRQTIDIVFGVILALIIIGIAIGAGQLVFSVWDLFKLEGVTGQYINIITDVLTLYVLIELSRSITDYFISHKLKISLIIDAAIVFIIREILIALFKHKIDPSMLYALSTFLFVLGALRTAAIILYQREKVIADENHD
ncbi:phosphate-starvation-inducible PsiE family protein [Cycloclasticus pugetii]|uniref:phosphate-starvation-inducible PsiE family protein n=1 Tax=Cycloclasticus pugetii TaxID=34068 RepID=UPI00037FD862|nr:phosphate-starvation-inducible PsiE family protein [Cycloclasticus pugetii]